MPECICSPAHWPHCATSARTPAQPPLGQSARSRRSWRRQAGLSKNRMSRTLQHGKLLERMSRTLRHHFFSTANANGDSTSPGVDANAQGEGQHKHAHCTQHALILSLIERTIEQVHSPYDPVWHSGHLLYYTIDFVIISRARSNQKTDVPDHREKTLKATHAKTETVCTWWIRKLWGFPYTPQGLVVFSRCFPCVFVCF